MSEQPLSGSEDIQSTEVRFGDVVRVILPDGSPGESGVVVSLSADALVLDNLVENEEGSRLIEVAGGTVYRPVEIIGHIEDALPKAVDATRETMKKFNVPKKDIEEAVRDLEQQAAKGPLTYTPPKPRTEEETAALLRQLLDDSSDSG